MQNAAGKGRVKPHSQHEVTKHSSRASAAAEPSAQEDGKHQLTHSLTPQNNTRVTQAAHMSAKHLTRNA